MSKIENLKQLNKSVANGLRFVYCEIQSVNYNRHIWEWPQMSHQYTQICKM